MTPTCKGIDVSGWNGQINWNSVKADGIGFAIIKMGNVYQSSGTVDLESTFRRNVAECERIGLPYGVYLYTYVRTPERMKTVMPYVVQELKQTCKKMWAIPCYLDIEEQAVVSGGRANTLAIVQAFCAAVEKGGYKAGVYSSTYWWNTYMPDAWFDTKAKWCADWGSRCDLQRSYGIWQYSDKGRVAGISGPVDMNYAYFDVAASKPKPIEKGDVNADGKVDAQDARKTLRASAKLEKLTPEEEKRADVDGDGKVTAKDARKILRKSAKLE